MPTERNKKRIIRYRNFKILADPQEYYREQILLFFPWRNELEEIETVDCKEKFMQHQEIIKENAKPYCSMPDQVLEEAVNTVQNEVKHVEEEEVEEFVNDELPKHYKVNVMDQGGLTKQNVEFNRYSTPQKVSLAQVNAMLQNLNAKQSTFVQHIYRLCTSNTLPFYIFLSGSAGVGKSTVINALFQLLTHYFDNLPGSNPNSIKVLLSAPSGKAAFLIRGVTLHTAFALPVSQFGGQMPELASDTANTIREKLNHLKCLIIDEISMVGSTLLSRVDTRLRQITGRNEMFGGISVIVVGDLNQLPPVMDSLVFLPPKNNDLNLLCGINPIWEVFKFYELTEIMRQKNEKAFIIALNNLVLGKMTNDDLNLFKSREVKEIDVPKDVIRLYYENSSVEEYNNLKITTSVGKELKSEATDMVIGKVSDKIKAKALDCIKKKKITETGGLPTSLRLKTGIKYMITTNIDVEDGLVNGTCGILKKITFTNKSHVDKLWFSFMPDTTVGCNTRTPFLNYMATEDIDPSLVPISKRTFTLNIATQNHYQIIRQQFPLTPAEALTIHKSQGQTFDSVCIDFNKKNRLNRHLLYVALSRVTKISGLYILGTFKAPLPPPPNDPTMVELDNLRQNKQLAILTDEECHSNEKVYEFV